METRIITIPVQRKIAEEEAQKQRCKLHGDTVLAAGMVFAFVLGIFTGFQISKIEAPREETLEVSAVEAGQLARVAAFSGFDRDEPAVLPDLGVPMTGDEQTVLLEVCGAYHIAPELALGLIQVESSFQADAVNPVSGCYGYCQLNPKDFPGGLSPDDNIRAGIGYLGEQLERYDNLEAALCAYNAGHDTGDRTYADKVLAAASGFAKE